MHASLADVIADTALNSLEANASRVPVELVEDGTSISVAIVFTHRRGDAAYSVVRSELAAAVGSLEAVEGLSLALKSLRVQETAALPPHLYKCGGRAESAQGHFP